MYEVSLRVRPHSGPFFGKGHKIAQQLKSNREERMNRVGCHEESGRIGNDFRNALLHSGCAPGAGERGVAAGLTLFSDTGQGPSSSLCFFHPWSYFSTQQPCSGPATPRVSSSSRCQRELPREALGGPSAVWGLHTFFSLYSWPLGRQLRPLRDVWQQTPF